MANPEVLGLRNGEKFCVIAVEKCSSNLKGGHKLGDGTIVLTELGPVLDNTWRSWLGKIVVDHLRHCNFVLLRSAGACARPGIVDKAHRQVQKEVNSLYWLLQLSGVPNYKNAFVILGSVAARQVTVLEYSEVAPKVYRSRGAPSTPVSIDRLCEAVRLDGALRQISDHQGDFSRFKRGLSVLWKALQSRGADDRLHEFVRSIEAFILPKVGKTKKQFVNRCQTLAARNLSTEAVLEEAFDMRSDIEHLHGWDRSLGSKRDDVLWQRTRQVEQLACFVYRKVLLDPTLWSWFKTDAAISKFWAKDEAERVKLWGTGLDLSTVT